MEKNIERTLGVTGQVASLRERSVENRGVIVIPTYRTGVRLLGNLLASFRGYAKYPIILVISDFREKDLALFMPIVAQFRSLPIIVETISTNSFELGGLYTAYRKTEYDEFFLLPHSCEIVDTSMFDRVFVENAGRSVALGLQRGDWNGNCHNRRDEAFVARHLDKETNDRLLKMGQITFWQGHIGKYRRAILDQMNLQEFLPENMIEAISKSELLFTNTYHVLDPTTVVLFPDWVDSGNIENKCGKRRLKICNRYIIKWKTHWTVGMVFDDMRRRELSYVAGKMGKRIAGPPFRWIKGKMSKPI